MYKRNVIAATALAVSVLGLSAGAAVSARPFGDCGSNSEAYHARFGAPDVRQERHLQHLMKKLDLTEAQRDQVFAIMHGKRPMVREKMKALRAGRRALKDLAMTENYEPEQVRELAEAQAELQTELMVMRTTTFNAVYGLLTPKQREKLAEWKEDRRQRSVW